MFSSEQERILRLVGSQASARGCPVYLVGGVVRDLLLGQSSLDSDVDFVIDGDGLAFAEALAAACGSTLKKFPQFMTAKVTSLEGFSRISEIDIATARREVYVRPGALPTVQSASIREDLARRDFSVNAMAIPIEAALGWIERGCWLDGLSRIVLDLFGGIEDLRERRVRTLHPKSFLDDPTRIFRACRYLGRLDGVLHEETERLLLEALSANVFATISLFRVMTELRKIFAEPRRAAMADTIERYGIAAHMLPLPEDMQLTISRAIIELMKLPQACSGDFCYRVLLGAIAFILDERERPKFYMDLGISKKEKERIGRDVQAMREERPLPTLSNEALLGLCVTGFVSDACNEELQKRGLRLVQ